MRIEKKDLTKVQEERLNLIAELIEDMKVRSAPEAAIDYLVNLREEAFQQTVPLTLMKGETNETCS